MTGFVPRISLAAAAFLVVTTIGLSGCTDSFTGYDVTDPARTTYDGPKFRHAHMLERALKPSDGVSKSADNGNTLGLIIGLQPGVDKQRLAERYRIATRFRLAERYKLVQRYDYDHAMYGFAWIVEDSLGGDFQQLFDSLAADPDIAFFEPDFGTDLQPQVVAYQSGSGSQLMPTGILRIGGSGHSADGVEVFVLDTGVSHSDVNLVEAVDLTDSPSGTSDIDGHGTHIAGTIAAIHDQDGVVGVAPGARIHSLKVLPDIDPNPDDGQVDLSTAIAAVEHATGQKLASPNTPMVVNISLGADIGTTQYTALDEAIEASSAAGVVYVVAAGNAGIDASTVTPAHAASAITVGAYDPADDQFASFSNYGPAVDILAPGVDVVSLEKGDGQDAVLMSGTSMATGHVTGAVALFLADNPQASAAQVAAALDASGDAVIGGVPAGTTDKTVRVSELLQMQVPPFFQYALLSGGNLKVEALTTVQPATNRSANANVFTNKNIQFNHTGSFFEGFGYYVETANPVSRANAAFQPAYNPTGLAPHQQAAMITVPVFNPQDFQHLATYLVNSDLDLSGNVQLGTRENPAIWYIDGKLKVVGDVTVSGYGVIMAKGDIEMKADLSNDTSTGETTLGLYAGGSIKMDTNNLTVAAQLFTNGQFSINGHTVIYGSVTAGDDIKIAYPMDVYYRPASPVLTDLFWPMNTGQ